MKSFLGVLLTFALIIIAQTMSGQSNQLTLSPEAEITLLTASPGDELYSVFGHSALRVNDPQHNLDLVFNYGTFDFNTPNFYMKFARGKLMYKLTVSRMEQFVPEYQREGRAIFEQVLNLSPAQKQKVFDFLMVNRLPENAYYHYDFFYDNCATRIRDVVEILIEPDWPRQTGWDEEVLAEVRSHFDYEFDYEPSMEHHRSFRDMLQPFLVNMPWSAFGIDLALGLPADRTARPWDFMYLPDEMLIAFDLAGHPNGEPLVTEHRIVIPKTQTLSPANFFSPQKVFWLVFLIGLLSFLSPKASFLFDRVFFTVLGITGIMVLLLWFFTDHGATKANLNILWAVPTHLYYIWISGKNRPLKKTYFRIISIVSVLLLILWPWIPQGYNIAFVPIILTSIARSVPRAFEIPRLSHIVS